MVFSNLMTNFATVIVSVLLITLSSLSGVTGCTLPEDLDSDLIVSDIREEYESGNTIYISCPPAPYISSIGTTVGFCTDFGWVPPIDIDCYAPCNRSEVAGLSSYSLQSREDTSTIATDPQFAQGDVLSYTCVSSYESASETMECDDGTWISSPPCLAPCPVSELDPRLSHSVVTGELMDDQYRHGSVVSFTCSSGTLVGDSSAECVDGSWSPSQPTCSDLGCQRPNSLDANIQLIPDLPTYPAGSFIQVACMDGSTMTAGATFTLCQSNSFSFALTDVVCSLDCADPAANQESLMKTGESYQHGETATYSCAENYNTLHGSATTTCNNGEWSPLPSETSCRAPCEAPSAASPRGLYEHGVSQTFSCDTSPTIRSTLTCNDGKWEGTELVCSGCFRPTILDANIQLIPDLTTYPKGLLIKEANKGGATVSADAVFTMRLSGSFTFSLSDVDCSTPCNSPPAAQPEGIYESGVSQTFTCDNSQDQATLECKDGNWSDPSFTCPDDDIITK